MTLTVGSLFSGVEGLGLGLERAGMGIAWQVELDPQCRSVLERHWPGVTRYDDVRKVHGADHCPERGCERCLPAVDVLTGGFPCQDLSVAGRRRGLGGARSGLWRELHRLMAELAPPWCLIENVVGLLSAVCPDPESGEVTSGGSCAGGCMATHGGALGTLLGALAGLGYGFAWRVLDAQHFGLAQRRARVFIVCRAGGDAAGPAQVLLEPESVPRDIAPGRTPQQEVAGTLGGGAPGRGWSDDLERAGAFIPEVAGTLVGSNRVRQPGAVQHHLVASVGLSTQGTGGSGMTLEELASPVTGSHGDGMVAVTLLSSEPRIDAETETFVAVNQRREARLSRTAGAIGAAPSATQFAGVLQEMRVRRLVPVERERLQGFPDDWTRWGADGKQMSDAARERMTGNAVPVDMAEWIGRKIAVLEPVA